MKKQTMDGNTAAAYISYAFTEVAGIFPITPSSPMAEYVDQVAAQKRPNLFGIPVKVTELQSEGGAAGTVHGSLAAGALTTTYTASQGLLLMIPNMYKISGELLPGVFHVSARALSVHGLSIFGDHSDVMACRQTGFAMLASSNPQEAMDLGAVSHLSAIRGRVPFLHFFDGFRTSHEIQKIDVLDYEDLRPLIDQDALQKFRKASLNPERPTTRGTTQNPDIYFQMREAANPYYNRIPDIVCAYMDDINKITGKNYRPFNYHGASDAENIIIAMGSVCDTIHETVDYLCEQGHKVGSIFVHLYRPFSEKYFLSVLPKTVKRIAVLDRTKEPGSLGEPLYQDIRSIFYGDQDAPLVIGGRYGLASKDTVPSQILAVFNHLESKNPKNGFTIGIEDDITFLSLKEDQNFHIPLSSTNCKIWGMGSDGTVGANKNTIKIIGEQTQLNCQAYFVYDSKKSGGLTQSHLRFGHEPIHSTYLVENADFVACHTPSYLKTYNMVKDLKPGGIFLLNCQWTAEELESHLPEYIKRYFYDHHIQLYIINAIDLASKLGLGERTNTILQAAFFKLVNIIPIDDAVRHMKNAIIKTYSKKGKEVVAMNLSAIDKGLEAVMKIQIPDSWKHCSPEQSLTVTGIEFIDKVASVMNRQNGDSLPVSAFTNMEDGTFPNGTTQYEKRGAAVKVPHWNPKNCIQCNLCSLVCPHAAIRPILLNESEAKAAPQTFCSISAKGGALKEFSYRIQISPLDCTGCGSCTNVCPSKEKALVMQSIEQELSEDQNWKYAMTVPIKKDILDFKNVKNTQFAKPLFEFSGACAGCGETPYIKLLTQLFGDSMYIGNASGCSSAYGGSTPSTPYCTNSDGHGPAWAMSLFEDNAEYVYGMMMGAKSVRNQLKQLLTELKNESILSDEIQAWLDCVDGDLAASKEASEALINALLRITEPNESISFILKNREYLSEKTYWAIGGDGWAYDIGYGGLDHVLASGENINILVLDTEVYSNTGGQASKSTPTGAIAKFAAAGKRVRKKDLGMMAMSYGYVYVAQVSMGADPAQLLRAFQEAQSYNGPSIIIAYCPCIEHGMKFGMSNSQLEMKRAVQSGYWQLYHYDPRRESNQENPFVLDSKVPEGDFMEFLQNENRFASLARSFPDEAKVLFEKAENDCRSRYQSYQDKAKFL